MLFTVELISSESYLLCYCKIMNYEKKVFVIYCKKIIDLGDFLCEKKQRKSSKSIIIFILLHTDPIIIETFSTKIDLLNIEVFLL
jgi:hypothetical protein